MTAILDMLVHWTPMLASGFVLNVGISLGAMAIGTVIGTLIGLGRLGHQAGMRRMLAMATHFCRNTPSIVLLFYLTYLLPFEIGLYGTVIPIPAWSKAVIGLSVPVIGFMSDTLFGALRGIGSDQWEAATALGYNRWQTLTRIILPQTVPLLLPPWMSYFAVIVMASSTASMVGVREILSSATMAMEAMTNSELVIPMYLYVLLWFFLFCYPISRLTQRMEKRRWAPL